MKMMTKKTIIVFVTILELFIMGASSQLDPDRPNGDAFRYQVGDPQNCPRVDDINMLEVLPGSGWDNLRNVYMGPVLDLQYTSCRITQDRKFIIPDDIHIEPLKKSNVHLHSKLMSHFSNYTSVTSHSINLEAHASYKGFSVSGSFSQDHQQAKSNIVNDKTVTSRVQLRYNMYKVRSQPNTALHPALVDRLMDIASYIQANDSLTANYLAELLVRDYGTHYISSVDAGAVILKEDQVTTEYIENVSKDKKKTTATASAFFLSYFGMSATYTTSVTQDDVNKYRENCVDSQVKSYGGPMYRANFSLDRWIDDIENNLVATDINGDPLFYVVSPRNIPQLPVDTIQALAETVKTAVESYYKYNIYKGCTSLDSPNFCYIANVDDNSCEGVANNYTFGGLYQTCTGGLCAGHTQVNPKTGAFSCSDGYTPVLLQKDSRVKTVRRCKHVWFIQYGCWDDKVSESWSYEIYWCAAMGSVGRDSGYLYGGSYTDQANNPLTQSKTCPDHFTQLTVGYTLKMHICISDDYELGFRYSIPFAGFFSCSAGNPLALVDQMSGTSGRSAGGAPRLASFVMDAGSSKWPKTCPQGFSQHLLAINAGCEINYCVKAGLLTGMALPIIRRPPYETKPDILYNATRILVGSDGHVMVKIAGGKVWNRTDMDCNTPLEEVQDLMPPFVTGATVPSLADKTSSSPNVGLAVGLSVTGTAIVGILILALVLKWRGRKSESERYRPPSGIAQATGYNTFAERSGSDEQILNEDQPPAGSSV